MRCIQLLSLPLVVYSECQFFIVAVDNGNNDRRRYSDLKIVDICTLCKSAKIMWTALKIFLDRIPFLYLITFFLFHWFLLTSLLVMYSVFFSLVHDKFVATRAYLRFRCSDIFPLSRSFISLLVARFFLSSVYLSIIIMNNIMIMFI